MFFCLNALYVTFRGITIQAEHVGIFFSNQLSASLMIPKKPAIQTEPKTSTPWVFSGMDTQNLLGQWPTF